MLTKTKYLHYLEAPMHLWAEEHGWLEEETPSEYTQHLMRQGLAVQELAQEFLSQKISEEHPGAEINFETILIEDDRYYARLDAAVYFPDSGVWDIYEIKSSSSIKKEHLLDAAFQRLIAMANLYVRGTCIVHINKHFRRAGEVDLEDLFVVENVNQEIRDLCEELRISRELALQITQADSPDEIPTCTKPKACPCPRLCHPNLPKHSIYDLPRIWRKVPELRAAGISAIEDIPEDFELSSIQAAHAEAVRGGTPVVEVDALRSALDEMEFPLYFLDYETYNPAVPWYDGYGPYQHMVFQYSLHVFDRPGVEANHHEYLVVEKEDPVPRLAANLLEKIGETGSVVVWNKSFEMGRNREMAALHPRFAAGLNLINERIFDLMEIFSKGSYVHPDFHGSASIKNVLPVLVPDLNYEGLAVPDGTTAMMVWLAMMSGELGENEIALTRENLLAYCKMDTLAMVRIWQALLAVLE
jgi:hypothetical protein